MRCCTDWIDTYMKYTDNSEPPVLFRKWTAVATIASVLQRKCVLKWGYLEFFPNMYTVLVAPSGRCRKGTAMGPGYAFLRALGIKVAAEAITREALIKELKECNAIDVATITEQTVASAAYHSSLTIYSPELTVFLGYNNLQLMSDLTDWYDCRDKWTYRTKNVGTDKVIGVWVNLLGATTPELLQSTLPRDAIGGGLTSRIIFVYESQKAKSVALPFYTEEEKALYIDLENDLRRILLLTGEFKVTEAFIKAWMEWYPWQETHKPFNQPLFEGYLERRPNHLLKLSIIMSASRKDSLIIDEVDFTRARNLLEQTEKNMPKTFSGVGKADNADVTGRVMTYIAEKGVTTYTELLKVFHYDADLDQMKKVLATLEAMDFCSLAIDVKSKVVTVTHKKDPHVR